MITNTASVSSALPDLDLDDNFDSVTATVPAAQSDLRVTKSQSSSNPSPNADLTYTVVVSNLGPCDVAGGYSNKPPSSTDKPLSWHPARREQPVAGGNVRLLRERG